jgi:hypothetical protein
LALRGGCTRSSSSAEEQCCGYHSADQTARSPRLHACFAYLHVASLGAYAAAPQGAPF